MACFLFELSVSRFAPQSMTYSHFDPPALNPVPWNFGAKIGPKRPFSRKQIWARSQSALFAREIKGNL